MAPENILDKIKKLMDLEQGARDIGSLEEANNAAEKVRMLLLKHNLEMADISLHVRGDKALIDKFNFEDISPKKNEGQWILALYNTLAKYNLCTAVTRNRKRINGLGETEQLRFAILVGTKTNVEVVRILALRLEERIRIFEKQSWKEHGWKHKNKNAYRRAYFMGAVNGLDMQLWEAQRKEKQEQDGVYALVVQTEKDLNDALANLFSNIKHGKRVMRLSNEEALHRGYRDGNNMAMGEGLN